MHTNWLIILTATYFLFNVIFPSPIEAKINKAYGIKKKQKTLHSRTQSIDLKPRPQPAKPTGCPLGCQCISDADLLQSDSPGLLIQCANTNFVDIGTVLLHVTAAYPNSEITWLVLYNNTFAQSTLRSSSFYDTGVTASLRYLAVEQSNIDDIEPMTFSRLSALRTLSLRSLKLTYLRPGALAGLKLETLDLSGNNFARGIERHFFDSMTTERLAVNYANLSVLTAERIGPIVKGLRAIEFEGNKLKHIHIGLEKYFSTMEYLKLSHNPWHCGPALLWLKQLYDAHPAMFRLESSEDLYCSSPANLTGKFFSDVSADEFAPGQKTSTTSTSTTSTTTTTTTLPSTTTTSTTTTTKTVMTTTASTSTALKFVSSTTSIKSSPIISTAMQSSAKPELPQSTSMPETRTMHNSIFVPLPTNIDSITIDSSHSSKSYENPHFQTTTLKDDAFKTKNFQGSFTQFTVQMTTASTRAQTSQSSIVYSASPMTILLTFNPLRNTKQQKQNATKTTILPTVTYPKTVTSDTEFKMVAIPPSTPKAQPSLATIITPILAAIVGIAVLIGIAMYCACHKTSVAGRSLIVHNGSEKTGAILDTNAGQNMGINHSPSASTNGRSSGPFKDEDSTRPFQQYMVQSEEIDGDSILHQYEPFLPSSSSSSASSESGNKRKDSDELDSCAQEWIDVNPKFLSTLMIELRHRLGQRNYAPPMVELVGKNTSKAADAGISLVPLTIIHGQDHPVNGFHC